MADPERPESPFRRHFPLARTRMQTRDGACLPQGYAFIREGAGFGANPDVNRVFVTPERWPGSPAKMRTAGGAQLRWDGGGGIWPYSRPWWADVAQW
jgi:hypothetical protein